MNIHDYIAAPEGTVVGGKPLKHCTFISAVSPKLPCFILKDGKHFRTSLVERIVEADVDIDGNVCLDVETLNSRYLGFVERRNV